MKKSAKNTVTNVRSKEKSAVGNGDPSARAAAARRTRGGVR